MTGIYTSKISSDYAPLEALVQSQIDALGDLAQYDNCLALPDGFDIDAEFTMENLQLILDSDGVPATNKRMPNYPEFQPLVDLASLGFEKMLQTCHSSATSVACANRYSDMNFYTPNTFIGFEDFEDFYKCWIYSIVWCQSNDFEVIFHERDNASIAHYNLQSGFNHFLYKIPPSGTSFHQGRKCGSYAFEWKIVLGKDVDYHVFKRLAGQRV